MNPSQLERAFEGLLIGLVVLVVILPFYLLLKLADWAKL